MLKTRERLALLLFVATVLLVAVIALSGCQPAEDTETTETTTETTAEGETTTTAEGEEPPAPDGTTETTAGEGSLAPVSEQFKICTDCHSDFNAFLKDPDQKVLAQNFSHGLHLNKGYRCEDCHVVPTHQPDRIIVPPMQKCFTCHSQEENAIAPGACGACHPQGFSLVPGNHGGGGWLPPADPGLVKTVEARHADMAKEDRAYCEMCHAQQFCNDCHQTPMPHPGDWQAAHPQQVKSAGDEACQRCHPQEFLCNDCHHTGFEPGEVPWRLQHPPIVRGQGAESCFTCHNPLTCAHCHITGEFQDIEGPSGS